MTLSPAPLSVCLGVPAIKTVASAIDATSAGVPILMRPVRVAAIKVGQHVVAKISHIEIFGERAIVVEVAQVGARQTEHLIPSGARPSTSVDEL